MDPTGANNIPIPMMQGRLCRDFEIAAVIGWNHFLSEDDLQHVYTAIDERNWRTTRGTATRWHFVALQWHKPQWQPTCWFGSKRSRFHRWHGVLSFLTKDMRKCRKAACVGDPEVDKLFQMPQQTIVEAPIAPGQTIAAGTALYYASDGTVSPVPPSKPDALAIPIGIALDSTRMLVSGQAMYENGPSYPTIDPDAGPITAVAYMRMMSWKERRKSYESWKAGISQQQLKSAAGWTQTDNIDPKTLNDLLGDI